VVVVVPHRIPRGVGGVQVSALGFMLIGLGILTVWSGFDRVIVFDVLRSFIGAPVAHRDTTGKLGA
jgi:hypothetical protein